MSEIYVSSDQHYHHKNILRYANRPFKDIEEMNEKFIQNHNNKVKPEDEFYCLGDFSFGSLEQNQYIFSRLNGKKYLIDGNHDSDKVYALPWEWVIKSSYMELSTKYAKFVLCHFPMASWHHAGKGSVMLHGHCHYRLPKDPTLRRVDIGVDNPACKYSPFSIPEIMKLIKDIPIVKDKA